jgi:plastocyanin
MRRHVFFTTARGLLGAALLSCVGGDRITRPDEGVSRGVRGVPLAGPRSRSGPVAGALSASVPIVGSSSASSPIVPTFGSSTLSTSALAPAMRMLWQNTTTGDRSIWLMNGASWDGNYAALPQVPTAWSIAGSGDFNADSQTDIVWQNILTGDRSIWFMSGNTWGGSYAALPQVSTQWSIAGVGDFNADGKPDLVWQNTITGDRSIWFMNGSAWGGSYALLPQVSTQWTIVAVADFNADGKPDLVWRNTVTGVSSIWFMNGATWNSADYALLPTVPTAWRIAAAADFDGDADPDLVWQNTATGARSIWIMTASSWNGAYVSLPTVSTQWSIAGMLGSDAGPPPNPMTAEVAATPQITFDPSSVTIAVGGTVTWVFGSVAHNVYFDPVAGAPSNITGSNSSTEISRTFAQAGTFPYACQIHSGMSGTVRVF